MRRFFVKNILFVLAVNVLVKPIWVFFIDRNVQISTTGGSYGTYQALLSLSIIFQTVLDFGISSYNSRTIAQNPDKLKDIFPAMLSARLVLIVVYMSLAYILAWLFHYRGWELSLLAGVLLVQSLSSLVSFLRSNVAALHRFRIDGVLSVTDKLLMIVVCGYLLWFLPGHQQFKIEWFVATQIGCYFATAILAYAILRKIAHVRLHFSFHAPTVLRIIKDSLPYALLIFLMSIYNRADATMIERLCKDGKQQADIWAAAFRLMDVANILGLMFANILLPLFGRMLSEKHAVQPIVKVCVNMLLPFSFMVAIVSIFFSHEIMELLYRNAQIYRSANGNYVLEYEVVFACLMASFPAWCLMYVYSTLLTANGSLKILNRIAFAGVLINVPLNYTLIHYFNGEGHGAYGGAITSCITQWALALTFMAFTIRTVKLPINIKWVLAHVGFVAIIIALAYAVLVFVHTGWMLQIALFMSICIGLLFVFRFVTVGSIKQLMSRA